MPSCQSVDTIHSAFLTHLSWIASAFVPFRNVCLPAGYHYLATRTNSSAKRNCTMPQKDSVEAITAFECVIRESNPGLPDAARMATENFTTKPITRCDC